MLKHTFARFRPEAQSKKSFYINKFSQLLHNKYICFIPNFTAHKLIWSKSLSLFQSCTSLTLWLPLSTFVIFDKIICCSLHKIWMIICNNFDQNVKSVSFYRFLVQKWTQWYLKLQKMWKILHGNLGGKMQQSKG